MRPEIVLDIQTRYTVGINSFSTQEAAEAYADECEQAPVQDDTIKHDFKIGDTIYYLSSNKIRKYVFVDELFSTYYGYNDDNLFVMYKESKLVLERNGVRHTVNKWFMHNVKADWKYFLEFEV